MDFCKQQQQQQWGWCGSDQGRGKGYGKGEPEDCAVNLTDIEEVCQCVAPQLKIRAAKDKLLKLLIGVQMDFETPGQTLLSDWWKICSCLALQSFISKNMKN